MYAILKSIMSTNKPLMSNNPSCKYFPNKLFTNESVRDWQTTNFQYPRDWAMMPCENFDTPFPTGPCGARTGWAFMPGQIAKWRWSTDYDTCDPKRDPNSAQLNPVVMGQAPFWNGPNPGLYE